jgi:topoisomerase IV subunit A
MKEGLTWRDTSQRLWTVAAGDLKDWIGARAEAGRLPPKGFPKNNKFG